MPKSLEKKQILEGSKFSYHFDRAIYFNRVAKKIFSVEAIEDNSSEWLKKKIHEKNDSGEWEFFFNDSAPEAVKKEILRLLGG